MGIYYLISSDLIAPKQNTLGPDVCWDFGFFIDFCQML